MHVNFEKNCHGQATHNITNKESDVIASLCDDMGIYKKHGMVNSKANSKSFVNPFSNILKGISYIHF